MNDGAIIFSTQDAGEVLKIDANGDFYVKGRLVTNDIEVFLAVAKFAKGYIKDASK